MHTSGHHHAHDSAHDEDVARVRAAEQPPAHEWHAAATGRADVLGPRGLINVQRAAGNAAATAAIGRSPVLDVVGGSGSALDEEVRTDMEGRFGADFSDVRVHTGDAADASARSVSAHAYTVGSSIVFQRGAYDPGSPSGRTLLAHELTHVVQQRSGPVDGTPTGAGVSVSDPSDRFEREASANAERVMSMPAPAAPNAIVPAGPTTAGAVQRQAEEEEEVQASHDPSLPPLASVQREAEEEEEGQS